MLIIVTHTPIRSSNKMADMSSSLSTVSQTGPCLLFVCRSTCYNLNNKKVFFPVPISLRGAYASLLSKETECLIFTYVQREKDNFLSCQK